MQGEANSFASSCTKLPMATLSSIFSLFKTVIGNGAKKIYIQPQTTKQGANIFSAMTILKMIKGNLNCGSFIESQTVKSRGPFLKGLPGVDR